jgi:hypothetical protein
MKRGGPSSLVRSRHAPNLDVSARMRAIPRVLRLARRIASQALGGAARADLAEEAVRLAGGVQLWAPAGSVGAQWLWEKAMPGSVSSLVWPP